MSAAKSKRVLMADYARLETALTEAPIVPVITIDRVADAVPLANALAAGGLTVLEVTLRTKAGLEAIAEMKSARPDLVIGAGTICAPSDVDAATHAGSDFLVSPGITPDLSKAMLSSGVPGVPGTATVSEAMSRAAEGFEMLKLFPAVPVGGIALLKSIAGPLPGLKFMPTGGVREETAASFLALPNVIAVGGSWMVTSADIDSANWAAIEAKASGALQIGLNT